jgi:hypothetical protein
MTAAEATDFFLELCRQAGNSAHVDIDALAAGQRLNIHAPTVFAHVNELKQRGWIESAAPHALGGLFVRLTTVGASRSTSEQARRTGIAGRNTARSHGRP